MNTTPEIVASVTYDIGMLAQIALESASKIKEFKGKNLKSEAVFYNGDEEHFDGIKISTVPDLTLEAESVR